jgi:hypothetical protein
LLAHGETLIFFLGGETYFHGMQNSKIRQLTLPIILIAAQVSAASFPAQGVVTPPLTKCFIDVRNAHISATIFKKEGRLAVKVNAISTCNVPQHNVVLTVKIYKKGFVLPHLVTQKSTKGSSPRSQGFVVKNQFTFAYCKNRAKTKYYGVASAKATINNKHYVTAPVQSENTIELACGT